ncbi:MAG: hypothetical protein R2747_05250 [Pyrinomonadaceae bacterium]
MVQTKAQNSRPTPTPTPETPQIISRADDYPDNSRIITQPGQVLPEGQNSNLEEKINNYETRIKELGKRVNTLESTKENEYDRKQRRLLLNLDILSKAEQRAESLRKQLFDLIEKESDIKLKLDQLENNLRPEMIDRTVAFAGTMRPEELRETRRKNLENEKRNLQDLLTEITSNKNNLQVNVQKADELVEKLRVKLEKEIDEALADEEDN